LALHLGLVTDLHHGELDIMAKIFARKWFILLKMIWLLVF